MIHYTVSRHCVFIVNTFNILHLTLALHFCIEYIFIFIRWESLILICWIENNVNVSCKITMFFYAQRDTIFNVNVVINGTYYMFDLILQFIVLGCTWKNLIDYCAWMYMFSMNLSVTRFNKDIIFLN